MAQPTPPETLDPEDWNGIRALAHSAVDDAFDWLSSVRERPVWQPTPEAVVATFRRPLPLQPEGAESALPNGQRASSILVLVYG